MPVGKNRSHWWDCVSLSGWSRLSKLDLLCGDASLVQCMNDLKGCLMSIEAERSKEIVEPGGGL